MEQLPEGRRARILAEVAVRGMVRVSDLAGLLGVSTVTIRRDVAGLVTDGALRRVRGGVASISPADPGAGAPEGVRIGMLVPSLEYHWPGIVAGARDGAAAIGAELVLRSSGYGATDVADQAALLLAAGAGALLLAPDRADPDVPSLLGELAADGVPVVLLERDREPGWVSLPDVVATDHAAGTETAVRHLMDAGHRRLALVLHAASPHAEAIRHGWSQALAGRGLPDGDRVLEVRLRAGAGFEPGLDDVVAQLLSDGVTAALVHSDREAIGVVQACESLGVDVPGRLSVVAYDDEVAPLFNPPLTALRAPRELIGREAVALLAARLRDPALAPRRLLIGPSLVARATVAAPGVPTDARDDARWPATGQTWPHG